MKIGSFSHRGLRRLFEDNDASKVDPAIVDKLRLILGFLQDMASIEDLSAPPKWRAHQLSGDRRGMWSLSVTRNWRLTFRIDADDVLQDIDFEDYH